MTFASIIGQNEIKQRLGHALSGNPGHAYVFLGPKGIGRSHIALRFAAALLCQNPGAEGACGSCPSCRYLGQQVHPDFRELRVQDKEKLIPVESVRRRVGADIYLKPQISSRKVYLITADDLNEQGQNALLKSLEEPPPYVVFLLTASGTEQLLPTIISRTVIMRVNHYSTEEIMAILRSKQLDARDTALFCARFSNGIPGSAIELAENAWFHDLRQETIRFFSQLPRESRASLLTAGYAFFEQNRAVLDDILKIMSSLVRDLMVLAAAPAQAELVNDDISASLQEMAGRMRKSADWRERLGSAYQTLLSAKRGLALNGSFEVLACHLMLALRKEFTYA